MKYLLVLVLLAGCNVQVPVCTTDHGVDIMGFWDEEPGLTFDCQRYNDVESRLSEYMDISELRGYKVWLKASPSFTDYWGRSVGGYTQCETRDIVVGSGGTTYGHELIHAVTKCKAVMPIDEGQDRDHANWSRDGYFDIIERIAISPE